MNLTQVAEVWVVKKDGRYLQLPLERGNDPIWMFYPENAQEFGTKAVAENYSHEHGGEVKRRIIMEE